MLTPASDPYNSEWANRPGVTHFGRTGYLAARGVVALSGVLSVFLIYRLGVALIGTEGGLAAALLMAASPVEVFVGHEVRPDVVLESAVLLALLSFRRLGGRLRDDLLSGAALGAAAAIKFTGVLVAVPYLLARWLAPGPRVRGALAAGGAAALFWLLATPYALVRPQSFLGGAAFQLRWHYRSRALFSSFGHVLAFYLRTFAWSLGYLGAALAILGLFAVRRRLAAWAPALSYGGLLVLTLSSAYMHWHRLALSGVCVVSLLAAAGFDFVRRRWGAVAYVVLTLAALSSLNLSVAYVRGLLTPGARDLALAWIVEHVQDGARVFNSVGELGLDRNRFEVVRPTGSANLDRLVARQSDAVVWWGRIASRCRASTYSSAPSPWLPSGAFGEPPEISLRSMAYAIVVLGAPATLRPAYREVPLGHATVAASRNQADAALTIDGRLDTRWSTAGPQRHGDWLQLILAKPDRLGRVEVLLGDRPGRYGRDIGLWVTEDGAAWRAVESASARAPVEDQLDASRGGASQRLVFEPGWARGIRLMLSKDSDRSWSIVEIRLQAMDGT